MAQQDNIGGKLLPQELDLTHEHTMQQGSPKARIADIPVAVEYECAAQGRVHGDARSHHAEKEGLR